MNKLNNTTMNEINNDVINLLKQVGFTTTNVRVEINGKVAFYNEAKVRALQVLARKASLESDEAFEEFTKAVVVYKSRSKSSGVMHFRKDGKFEEEFEPGFFNVNDDLAMMLFQMQDILH